MASCMAIVFPFPSTPRTPNKRRGCPQPLTSHVMSLVQDIHHRWPLKQYTVWYAHDLPFWEICCSEKHERNLASHRPDRRFSHLRLFFFFKQTIPPFLARLLIIVIRFGVVKVFPCTCSLQQYEQQ